MNMNELQGLIYDASLESVKDFARGCNETEILHTFLWNYNWSDGFDIPQMVIDNPACSLSTALTAFYLGDGARYLTEKPGSTEIPEWLAFISKLYSRIVKNDFQVGKDAFTIPLTKVQAFKLKKLLGEDEMVFITSISGNNCDINL